VRVLLPWGITRKAVLKELTAIEAVLENKHNFDAISTAPPGEGDFSYRQFSA
jgi:hypothetical protein